MIRQGQNLMCVLPNFPETKTFIFKDLSSSNRAQSFVKDDQDDIEIVPDPYETDREVGHTGN